MALYYGSNGSSVCGCSREKCDDTCETFANRESERPYPASFEICTNCMICDNEFTISKDYYIPSICPECKERLKKILYPKVKI